MEINDILLNSNKPALYEKGTSFMWTDKHISKELLKIHLNPDLDLASRKASTIKKTVEWILSRQPAGKLKIIDLGCGPGLYTQLFAQNGHEVTGVDISENSIEYAKNQSMLKKLDIKYINASYLEMELEENKFDLVTMIYTDFGVLLPPEREQLLSFINRVLKKGGLFIFDVLNDKNFEKKLTPKNWEVVNSGFWKNKPYVALSESFLYPENKVILYQHIVFDESDKTEVYRFWTHFFSHSDLSKILTGKGFDNLSFHEDVLQQGDSWSGDNVTFCIAKK